MENAQTGYYVVALQIEDFKSSAENYAMSNPLIIWLLFRMKTINFEFLNYQVLFPYNFY